MASVDQSQPSAENNVEFKTTNISDIDSKQQRTCEINSDSSVQMSESHSCECDNKSASSNKSTPTHQNNISNNVNRNSNDCESKVSIVLPSSGDAHRQNENIDSEQITHLNVTSPTESKSSELNANASNPISPISPISKELFLFENEKSLSKDSLKKVNGIVSKRNDSVKSHDGRKTCLFNQIQNEAGIKETDTLLTSVPKKNGNVFSGIISDTKFSTNPRSPSIKRQSGRKRGGQETKGIVKSDSTDVEKPVHRVQFHNGPINNPAVKTHCPSPTISSSSSSSSSNSDDNSSLERLSEARAPDGGWGWVVVIASFMVNMIADGITFSFGVIYIEFLNYFEEGKSKTAWIGSLFMAMPLLSGPIASFLTDRYGCRRVCIVGSILSSCGFVMSAFTDSIALLNITFGVIAGFGLSLCYVAAVVIVAYYFDKRRSLATGLSVCGSGIGTFIFAPLIQMLLDEYGWRGTTLILAGFFLNLAVCGALMRDLPWASNIAKAKSEERKKTRKRMRLRNGSSADSFSASNSTNTASVLQPFSADIHNATDDNYAENDDSRLFSSLVNLPTFVHNSEKVPIEVLELLSTHKNVYNVLLQNYPGLLAPSRSFSDSGRLHELAQSQMPLSAKHVSVQSPLAAEPPIFASPVAQPFSKTDESLVWWLKQNQNGQTRSIPHGNRRLPTAYLKNLRVHRHSLTYRGAMLNINRYRLRASSCPDIYRNSMTTIAQEKTDWYGGLWEFWDLLVDMLDFSYFSDIKFLLFTISNFLLYMWYDVPYVYLMDCVLERGVEDTAAASVLISIIGIVNMFGEIILGWLGDMRQWMSPNMVYAVCMVMCGAVTALIPLLKGYLAFSIVSGLFGFFIAANYSLTSVILVDLITLERFTNAYGLLLLIQGVANLIGPPLAGWLYDVTGSYSLSFYLAGLFIALSGLLLVILPATHRYRYFQSLQRQANGSADESLSCDSAAMPNGNVKEPKFHSILASCITGNKRNGKSSPVNDV